MLLANCGFLFPDWRATQTAAPMGAETITTLDGQIAYASHASVPPPGFAEVAEFRTREICAARGASTARLVSVPTATNLQFECGE